MKLLGKPAVTILSSLAVSSMAIASPANQAKINQLIQQTTRLQQQLHAMQQEINQLKAMPKPAAVKPPPPHAKAHGRSPAWLENIATPVVTSPYVGIYPNEMGSNLIVNYPAVNEDLVLLQQRQTLANHAKQQGWTRANNPILTLSGKLEAQAIKRFGYNPTASTKVDSGDIDLSAAELQLSAYITDWASGFFQLDYDNSLDPLASLTRTTNARLYLKKGFITLGNLNQFPLYVTVGQTYVPYGRYASSMQNATLLQSLTRTKGRAIVLGYHGKAQKGVYASTYTFKGETEGQDGHKYLNWGAKVGYDFDHKKLSGDVGMSYIANMADAEGLQGVGSVFGQTGGSERLDHRVPGMAMHGQIGYGAFTLLGEWDQALRAYNAADLSFNNDGAKLRAFNTELTYAFHIMGKPTNVTLGYGQTDQAVVTGLPHKRFAASISSAIVHDTILSLEYDHDVNYSADDQGKAQDGSTVTGSGKHANTVLMQLGIYF